MLKRAMSHAMSKDLEYRHGRIAMILRQSRARVILLPSQNAWPIENWKPSVSSP